MKLITIALQIQIAVVVLFSTSCQESVNFFKNKKNEERSQENNRDDNQFNPSEEAKKAIEHLDLEGQLKNLVHETGSQNRSGIFCVSPIREEKTVRLFEKFTNQKKAEYSFDIVSNNDSSTADISLDGTAGDISANTNGIVAAVGNTEDQKKFYISIFNENGERLLYKYIEDTDFQYSPHDEKPKKIEPHYWIFRSTIKVRITEDNSIYIALQSRSDDVFLLKYQFDTNNLNLNPKWRRVVIEENPTLLIGLTSGFHHVLDILDKHVRPFLEIEKDHIYIAESPGMYLFNKFNIRKYDLDGNFLKNFEFGEENVESGNKEKTYFRSFRVFDQYVVISGFVSNKRTVSEIPEDHGFDNFLILYDLEQGAKIWDKNYHLSRADLLSDAIKIENKILAVGASDWTMNPTGFSVQSNSKPSILTVNFETGELLNSTLLEYNRGITEFINISCFNHQLSFGGIWNGLLTHTADHDDELFKQGYIYSSLKLSGISCDSSN